MTLGILVARAKPCAICSVTKTTCTDSLPSTMDSADSPTRAYTTQATQATPPTALEAGRAAEFLAQLNARLLRTYDARAHEADEPEDATTAPPRSKSFLNMTSSTLCGIYDDAVGEGTAGEPSMAATPWGAGAETPPHSTMGDTGKSARSRSHTASHGRHGPWKYAVISGKLAALYLFGAVYGLIVSQLHDTRPLAAVQVTGVDRRSRFYLPSWGLFGLVLGSLLPYVDLVWDAQTSHGIPPREQTEKHDSPLSEQINDVVRSVCAFVGIAFAIVRRPLKASPASALAPATDNAQRRLPWQSTLQLTLTLALVNPALWYILDRSKPGLSFSLIVTSILTSFIFLSNPNALPSPPLPSSTNVTQLPLGLRSGRSGNPTTNSPSGELFAGVVSYENLAVVTWVGSVLFCSCVCFGNIGRRLGVLQRSGSKH